VSYADVVSQMQAIQATLAQLGMLGSTASTSASASNAASFAGALQGATAASAPTASTTASTDGALISGNGRTGDDVVQAALAYKGVPYVLGGESKSGIDCSGLVQAAFGNLGISVPRLVHEQQTIGQKVDSLKDAKPGDLVVLNGGDHIAIWMGNDTVIHAPYPGRTVSVQKAWFTDKDVVTIRRVVPATDDASAATAGAPAASGVLGSGVLGGASAGSTTGLSAAAATKATAMLSTVGADVGLYDPTGGSGSTSLASLLQSFGLSGSGATGTSSTSTSAQQQILAARAALLGASA
jgi:peptidoglycan DL-endopeptidase CwlO